MSEQKISHKIKYLKPNKVKNPNWPNEPRYLRAWHSIKAPDYREQI